MKDKRKKKKLIHLKKFFNSQNFYHHKSCRRWFFGEVTEGEGGSLKSGPPISVSNESVIQGIPVAVAQAILFLLLKRLLFL